VAAPPELLHYIFIAAAALLGAVSSKARAVVKTIFRRPSTTTEVIKLEDNRWIDVGELGHPSASPPAAGTDESRNGGAGTHG
jgi:hypothetical protein